MLEEIIIRLENRKDCLMDFLPQINEAKASLHLQFHNTILGIKIWTVILDESRLNWIKSHKRSLFELEKISSIWSTSFGIENERRIEAFLAIFLSLNDFVLKTLISHFCIWVTVEVKASGSFGNIADTWYVLGSFFGYMTWWLVIHHHNYVKPALMIAAYWRSTFMRWLPVRS